VNIVTKETCPTCNGTGKITASILVSDLIEKTLDHLLVKQNEKNLVLALHPYLHAFFTKGFISMRMKWFFKYKRVVHLEKDSSMGVTEFKFLNQEGEEIQLTA
jgi:ribonuclease G